MTKSPTLDAFPSLSRTRHDEARDAVRNLLRSRIAKAERDAAKRATQGHAARGILEEANERARLYRIALEAVESAD